MSSMKIKRSHNNESIQVVVRVRPLNGREKSKLAKNVVEVRKPQEIVVPERPDSNAVRTYKFDQVFGEDSRQFEIFDEVVLPLIEEVLIGYHGTVFAYGQTGSGKTFTMEGEQSENSFLSWDEDPKAGLIPRTLHYLFEHLPNRLYNEDIYDLLSDSSAVSIKDMQKLKLQDTVVKDLTEITVTTKDQVFDLLERGRKKRITAATKLNDSSSRSHTVFSIKITLPSDYDGDEWERVGKLNLVDLAGSESIAKSGAVDQRAREAGIINKSLLTLGRVITALAENSVHIPFRESTLTRILKDSLGGATKACVIANISASDICLEETQRTFDFALRAKNITNKPTVNIQHRKNALGDLASLPPAPATSVFFPKCPPFAMTNSEDSKVIRNLLSHFQHCAELHTGFIGDIARKYQKHEQSLKDHMRMALDWQQRYDGEHRKRLRAEKRAEEYEKINEQLRQEVGNLRGRLNRYETDTRRRQNIDAENRRREAEKDDIIQEQMDRFKILNEAIGGTPIIPFNGGESIRKAASQESIGSPSTKVFGSQQNLAGPSARTPRTVPKTLPHGRNLYPSIVTGTGLTRTAVVTASARKFRRAPSPPPKPTGYPPHLTKQHRRSKSAGGIIDDIGGGCSYWPRNNARITAKVMVNASGNYTLSHLTGFQASAKVDGNVVQPRTVGYKRRTDSAESDSSASAKKGRNY